MTNDFYGSSNEINRENKTNCVNMERQNVYYDVSHYMS